MPEAPPQPTEDPQFVSKLAYQIVRQQINTQAKISAALDDYAKQFEGTSPFAYQIRQEDHTIVGVDRETGEQKLSYRIPLQPNEGAVKWIATSPDYVAVIDESTGHWQKVVQRGSSYGLALTSGHGLWSFPSGVVAKGKALYQGQWVYEKIPEGELTSGPLDLFVSPREGMMVVSDRAGGQLHLIDPRGGEVLKSLSVRDTPSPKSICVAISASKPQAFATDQASADLILIEFDVRAARRLPQQWGTLGNLVLSPDDKMLYVLRTDPEQPPAVLAVNTADLTLAATIPLPGKWFSHLDDPSDLIAISPNARWLCVMTYVDEPSLVTPALTVIDVRKHEVHETFVLKEDEKPAALAFLAPEPRQPQRKVLAFGELLVQKKLIDQGRLRKLSDEVMQQLEEARKPALDEDVARQIEGLLAGAQITDAEIAELEAPGKSSVDRLVAGDGVDWIANAQLDKGERRAFAQRVADIKADDGTNRANSALVVNLIRPEEEVEPERPPEYEIPPEEDEEAPAGEADAAVPAPRTDFTAELQFPPKPQEQTGEQPPQPPAS